LRFEALLGDDINLLKSYYKYTPIVPYITANQLKVLQADPECNSAGGKLKRNLAHFFPQFSNVSLDLITEKKRFAAFYDSKDVQEMFQKGILFLDFTTFSVVTQLGKCEEKMLTWNYYANLVSEEQLKSLGFGSTYKDENNRYINGAQIIFLFSKFGEVKFKVSSLNDSQKEHIQKELEHFCFPYSVTGRKKFLKDFQMDLKSTLNQFFSPEEVKKLLT
jgi:hypothetical protein